MRGFGLILASAPAGAPLQGQDVGGDEGPIIGPGQGRNSARSFLLWEAGIAFTWGPLHVPTLFAGGRGAETEATEFKIDEDLQNMGEKGRSEEQIQLCMDCHKLDRLVNSICEGLEGTSEVKIGLRGEPDKVTISGSALRVKLDKALPHYPWLWMSIRGQGILPLIESPPTPCSLKELKEDSKTLSIPVLAVIKKGRVFLQKQIVSGSWRPSHPAIQTLLKGLTNVKDVKHLIENTSKGSP